MNEIFCPNCKKVFKVDEAGFAVILKQVQDHQFEEELHKQLNLAEKEKEILPKTIKPFQKKIIDRLISDQSQYGNHSGQFGKSCDNLYSDKWQSKEVEEKLYLKPRMYLTYWPVFILKKHKINPYAIDLAIKGLRQLFFNGKKIPVFSSAPQKGHMEHYHEFNFRHTMAAAHIFTLNNINDNITCAVIEQMIDPDNLWQDSSGGWKQTSDETDSTDLWASAYAIKLLDYAIESEIPIFKNKIELIVDILNKTIEYFEIEFYKNCWGIPGKLLVEENLVSLYIELAPIFNKYSNSLKEACPNEMKKWIDSAGYLKESYLNLLKKQKTPVSEQQASVRIAYAFYLSNDHSVDWKHYFEIISNSSLKSLFSSELAFLLDLSYNY